MSLNSLALAGIVPPVNLLLPAIAGAVIIRRRPGLGQWLIGLALGGMLLLSLPQVSGTLLASLQTGLPPPRPLEMPGAIVILGGDSAKHAGRIDAGPLTLERERTGAALARETGLPVLVTGGPVDGGPTPLALAMARSLQQDFGIFVRWVEPQADDTLQNARFSAALLRHAGVQSVFLVTQGWHMRRAMQAFTAAGLGVTPVPVRIDTVPDWRAGDLVPGMHAWMDSYLALHEWIGLAAAALRGH